MKEIELWSEIDKEKFTDRIEGFTNKFGKPTRKDRMAFRFVYDNNFDVNTRIRITNGVAEVVQKTEYALDRSHSEEVVFPLDSNSEQIFKMTKFFKNILSPSEDSRFYLIQFENHIWNLDKYEIKLTRHIANNDIYSFEVEITDESLNLNDLENICLELDLPVKNEVRDSEFWVKFNERANINVKQWSDDKIKEVIEKYLKLN